MDSIDSGSGTGSTRVKAGFPPVPVSWFYLCPGAELNLGPVSVELCGRKYVGYRTRSGRAVVLSGRCSHLGAPLENGTVNGERLVCPLHGWEYGPGGLCEKIPAAEAIPGFARQISYPVEERYGHIFFFNHQNAAFPMPSFEGLPSDQLLSTRPFDLVTDTPWYFIGANGFDIQHFRMAHDRTLTAPPEVSSPSPFARRLEASFEVSGHSFQDRLTRWVAGGRVIMNITVWGGSLILVRAEFPRTTSFGIFNVLPVDGNRTRGRVVVCVRRSRTALGRALFDPLNAAVRRTFIQRFLRSDLPRVAGLRYQPGRLIEADKVLAEYFTWLENLVEPLPTENT